MNAIVKDVMTTQVVAVRQDATYKDMATELREGRPETAAVGHDIISSIRHVEGVVAVRDRLSYPPVERPSSPGPLF
jgi:Mg/Co/Ni transporter MgtE